MDDDTRDAESDEVTWRDFVPIAVFFAFFAVLIGTGALGFWSPTAEDNPEIGEIGSNISVDEPNSSSRAKLVTLDVNVSTVSGEGEVVFKKETIEPASLSNFSLIGFETARPEDLEEVNESCLSEFNTSAREQTRGMLSDGRVAVFNNTVRSGYDLYWFSSNESEHVGLSLAREGLAVYAGSEEEPPAQQEAREERRGVWSCVSER